ncbi:MAG: sel1 repeat family protein, partial [Solobacterium sp.]|nr:sel1 repeat family protein [Solobacterium sp.]
EYIDLIKKAADLGEGFAGFTLGVAYMTGDGVQADQEQAVHYLQIAAEQGIPDAKAFLAHEYYFGIGVKGDTRKAIQLLSNANEYFITEETCKKIRTDLLALNRGRKKPSAVYPFWFMQKNEPVITKAILSKALRSYIEEEVDRATDNRMSEVLMHLQRLETITMDTNIRTRDIQTDLAKVYRYLTVDLSRMLKEEKNLLGNHLDQEEQLNRFFDRITKYINENVMSADDLVSEQSQILAHRFGSLWDRLLPESRSSLISAAVLMKTCKDIHDDSFDFSGVCISATSALEGELKRIFCTGFMDYMEEHGTSQEDINYVSRRITKAGIFTLGSMPFVLAESDKMNATEKQRIKELVLPYLHSLIPGTAQDQLPGLFSSGENSLLSRIDYVRENYRNSAAHSDNLTRQTAMDCCRDVIGTEDTPGLLIDILKLF